MFIEIRFNVLAVFSLESLPVSEQYTFKKQKEAAFLLSNCIYSQKQECIQQKYSMWPNFLGNGYTDKHSGANLAVQDVYHYPECCRICIQHLLWLLAGDINVRLSISRSN